MTSRERRRRALLAKKRERLAKRAADRKAKEAALFAHGEKLDEELRAAGVTDAELVRRRLKALVWTELALAMGEREEAFIVLNQTRIIRGMAPLDRRKATMRPPRRGELRAPRREVSERPTKQPRRAPSRFDHEPSADHPEPEGG